MSLKPCRECGKKVSTKALTCPNCGVPIPTHKTESKTKIKSIGANETYARCEKTFCKNKYEIIVIPRTELKIRVCSRCGNELDEVSHEDAIKDIARKETQKDIVHNKVYKTSKPKGKYFFDGTEGLAKTFWGYFIGGNAVLTLLAFGMKNDTVISFIIIIQLVWYILAIIGVFKAADIYKAEKIKEGQSYGYATVAKVACVILALSSIGNSIPK